MNVSDLLRVMDAIAPTRRAGSWDNVGLLCGAGDWPADRIMLTIDCTPAVISEAIRLGAQCIVAYHPPILTPMSRITDATWRSKIVLDALSHRIAIHSPHSALDAAPDGLNDWLIDGFGPGETIALEPTPEHRPTETHKIVFFCPPMQVDAVCSAMHRAGAGRIGAYDQCSFRLAGSGTFRGDDSTTPAVGKRGRLERVDEIRVEMVCGAHVLQAVTRSLVDTHPYEEPAYDIYELTSCMETSAGMGRLRRLDAPLTLQAIIERMTRHLRVDALRVATARSARRTYRTVGVCAGAGGSFLGPACEAGCELFLTGEMRYHDVLDGQHRGCSIALAGHSNTERGYLSTLRQRLRNALPGADIRVARRDVYPIVTMRTA